MSPSNTLSLSKPDVPTSRSTSLTRASAESVLELRARTETLCPSSSRRAARWLPRNPVAPVTKTFLRFDIYRLNPFSQQIRGTRLIELKNRFPLAIPIDTASLDNRFDFLNRLRREAEIIMVGSFEESGLLRHQTSETRK